VPCVTSNAPFTRIATLHAPPGQGDRLVERLQHAAELLAEASGCEMWLVHRDHEDPHTVRISELWSTREQCDAALTLPAVSENAAGVMALLDGPPEVVDGEPVAGARALRGTAGASRFSILDAPDLSQDTELLGRYDLGQVGEARYVRQQLGAAQTGLTHYRLRPGRNQGWAHRHRVAEEIYVVLSGSGRIKVDDERFELGPLDAVRVAPGSARELAADDDGLEVLAFGLHSPGDGEMVSDWSPA
jgi:mannose-6-phosphate isomerase-like protein (cupin superfamily)/quinol monooxygenase YgiN